MIRYTFDSNVPPEQKELCEAKLALVQVIRATAWTSDQVRFASETAQARLYAVAMTQLEHATPGSASAGVMQLLTEPWVQPAPKPNLRLVP